MRRAVVVVTGILIGFVVGLVVLGGGLLVSAALLDPSTSLALLAVLVLPGAHGSPDLVARGMTVAWAAALALCFAPVAFAALVGEAARVRGALWYPAAAGAVTAATPTLARAALALPGPVGTAAAGEAKLTLMLFLVGAASGIAYWVMAGRSVGER